VLKVAQQPSSLDRYPPSDDCAQRSLPNATGPAAQAADPTSHSFRMPIVGQNPIQDAEVPTACGHLDPVPATRSTLHDHQELMRCRGPIGQRVSGRLIAFWRVTRVDPARRAFSPWPLVNPLDPRGRSPTYRCLFAREVLYSLSMSVTTCRRNSFTSNWPLG
jgi:hypothetical protein